MTAYTIRLSPPAGISRKRGSMMQANTGRPLGRSLGARTLLSPAVHALCAGAVLTAETGEATLARLWSEYAEAT